MKLFSFKSGDRILFGQEYDPGFAPDDPFYAEPVPKGTQGVILDVGKNHVRVKLDDSKIWPSPILVWEDNAFDDDVRGGTSCLRLLDTPR